MGDKPKLKYEKPVSIDMGRVSPVLGQVCSTGTGASDCSPGFNNTYIPSCGPIGLGATNWCQTGEAAQSTCQTGNAALACLPGASATYGFPP